jgi:hypothetical protein
MSKMYIRVKKDGFIFEYNEILAKNPTCEVITEQEAFPERFVPEHVADRVETPEKPKREVKRKSKLDLATTDIPEAPTYTSPELASDAAKGMP